MEADAKGFFDRYMATLGDGLTQLARPAVSADLAQVRAIAHDLKSTSALIGAAAMTAVMTALQEVRDRDDTVSVADALARLPALHAALRQAHRVIVARLG